MKTLKNILLLFIAISLFVSVSCKKTEEDKENETLLVGTWYTTNNSDTMLYVFGSDSKGSTTFQNAKYEFSWEVKKGYLSTYYEKSPSYHIGYDKYNSKGYYKVNFVKEKEAEMVQIYFGGLEVTRTFTKK